VSTFVKLAKIALWRTFPVLAQLGQCRSQPVCSTVMLEEFLSVKDLARTMAISTRSVMRWSQRLSFPPSREGNACNRWNHADAVRFIAAWQHWQTEEEDTKLNYFARMRLAQAADPALQRSWAAWLVTDDQLAGRKNGSRRRQSVQP